MKINQFKRSEGNFFLEEQGISLSAHLQANKVHIPGLFCIKAAETKQTALKVAEQQIIRLQETGLKMQIISKWI